MSIYFRQDATAAEEFLINELAPTYEDFHLKILSIKMPNIYEKVILEMKYLRKEEIRFYEGIISYP